MTMLIGSLFTFVGHAPIGFAGGSAYKYVRSFFYVVTVALTLSWIVAVLVTPYIAFSALGVGYDTLKQALEKSFGGAYVTTVRGHDWSI